MKMFFISLFALVSLNAFATHELCQLQDTNELDEAVERKQIRVTKTSDNHKAFTQLEKTMIHLMINQEYKATLSEALNIFGDYHEYTHGETGSNAGSIVYMARGNYQFALVHYFPGDNEYGALITSVNNRLVIIATINDGFFECKL